MVFNNLNTRDAAGARAFYGAVFGCRTAGIGGRAEGWTLPGTATGSSASIIRGCAGGWRQPAHRTGSRTLSEASFRSRTAPPHWSVTFASADADATAARAVELGGTVIVPPFDAPWSTGAYTIRITVIGDPGGVTFAASTFVPAAGRLG